LALAGGMGWRRRACAAGGGSEEARWRRGPAAEPSPLLLLPAEGDAGDQTNWAHGREGRRRVQPEELARAHAAKDPPSTVALSCFFPFPSLRFVRCAAPKFLLGWLLLHPVIAWSSSCLLIAFFFLSSREHLGIALLLHRGFFFVWQCSSLLPLPLLISC